MASQCNAHVARQFIAPVFLALLAACKTVTLTEAGLADCLKRTDHAGMNMAQREAIAWFIRYDDKVRATQCCAIEPRSSVLAKQDRAALKAETLSRIDTIEAGGDAEARAELRRSNLCYAALMDLYHDITAAQRVR